jgi:high frequency lysogenization protein
MNQEKIKDRALALAGILQPLNLINELAKHGNCNAEAFGTCINTIDKVNSTSVSGIYGAPENLRLGLLELEEFLNFRLRESHQYFIRYFINVLRIAKRLLASTAISQELRQALENITRQFEYFSPTHETVLANLAGIYTEIIGKLQIRIIILGKEQYLTATDIQHKVRALLLAAVRSCVLWLQLGGSRIQLLLQRNQLLKACQDMKKSAIN